MVSWPYRAPEIFERKSYSYQSDWWSAGVVIVELFGGSLRIGNIENHALKNIKNTLSKYTIKQIAPGSPKYLEQVLKLDPQERRNPPSADSQNKTNK